MTQETQEAQKTQEAQQEPQTIKRKCKFCGFECEGTEEEVSMQMLWHDKQNHYPIYIGNELHKLADNITANYLRS